MTTNFLTEQKLTNDPARRAIQRAMFAHPDMRELSQTFAQITREVPTTRRRS